MTKRNNLLDFKNVALCDGRRETALLIETFIELSKRLGSKDERVLCLIYKLLRRFTGWSKDFSKKDKEKWDCVFGKLEKQHELLQEKQMDDLMNNSEEALYDPLSILERFNSVLFLISEAKKNGHPEKSDIYKALFAEAEELVCPTQ